MWMDCVPRWLLRLGLFVYDHAGGREKLAASAGTRLAGTPLGAPLRAGITDGFEYSDCAVDDSRLVVLNALDAAERGATVLTRQRVVAIASEAEGWRITIENLLDNARRTLRTRVLVNATGAWVNNLLTLAGIEPRQHLRLVKGSHLVLKPQYEGDHAYLLQSADRRVVFAIPWEGLTLVGTTDMPFDGDPAHVGIDAGEKTYLLSILNRFLRKPASEADIVATYSGVRPLYDDGSKQKAQQVSRDYHLELQHNAAGAAILSVYGGKITTYRRLAEHALQLLLPALDIGESEPWTAEEPLPGGDLPDADFAAFNANALARWPQLPPALITRPRAPLRHAHGPHHRQGAAARGSGHAFQHRPHSGRGEISGGNRMGAQRGGHPVAPFAPRPRAAGFSRARPAGSCGAAARIAPAAHPRRCARAHRRTRACPAHPHAARPAGAAG